jgi:thiol-disulfide isomerase/thioredoxin
MRLMASINAFAQLTLTGSPAEIDRRKLVELNKGVQDEKARARIDSLFAVQHLNSYVVAEQVSQGSMRFGSIEYMYGRFTKTIRESFPGKNLRFEIEKEKHIAIGRTAGNFVAIDHKGDTIRLSDYAGKKYVLLDFGASWCAPCRRILPQLKRVYAGHASELEIISISNQEEEDDWWKSVANDSLAWPQILENKNHPVIFSNGRSISDAYYVDGIPALVLIDKHSKIIGKFGGAMVASSAFTVGPALEKILGN